MVLVKRFALLLTAAFLMFTFSACEKEGPMEKAGKKADEAVEKTEEAVEDAADAVKKKTE